MENGGAYELGTTLSPLQLEREQREQLEAMASSRSLPHGLVTRCESFCSAPTACPIRTSLPGCD